MKRVRITSAQIEECFADKTTQSDVLVAIYKIAFPEWDRIASIEGWPKVNKATWKHIASKFMEFDKVHHDDCMAGGLWMNRGFSSDDSLPNWVASMDGVSLTFTPDEVLVLS